ncbi:MAG: ribonuclease P protein component [Pseudorhodobacter sp.]
MIPPEAEGKGSATPRGPAAVSHFMRPEILRKRADFLRAASARRQGTPGFLLQARDRGEGSVIRVGFTCSRKIGNAVMRNRAKRRLREIARSILPGLGRPGWDYVLVGRPGATVDRDFESLLDDLRKALMRIHDASPRPEGLKPPRGRRRGRGGA